MGGMPPSSQMWPALIPLPILVKQASLLSPRRKMRLGGATQIRAGEEENQYFTQI